MVQRKQKEGVWVFNRTDGSWKFFRYIDEGAPFLASFLRRTAALPSFGFKVKPLIKFTPWKHVDLDHFPDYDDLPDYPNLYYPNSCPGPNGCPFSHMVITHKQNCYSCGRTVRPNNVFC